MGTGNPPPAAIPFLAGTRIRPGAEVTAARFVLGALVVVAFIGALMFADQLVQTIAGNVQVLP